MKIIFSILILFAYSAHATIYYVSNTGNDGDNGTISTPWRTIAKINSSTFLPDDVILFQSGGVWVEALKLSSSGTAGHPITIGSYGTGLKPLITGFQTVTLASQGSNLWGATINTNVNRLNTVVYNGKIRAKGRTNYAYQHASTTTQINNTGLTGTPNYTGGEVVVRAASWILDKGDILSQSGQTLNITALNYSPEQFFGYFIQNLPVLCTKNGDWAFNYTSKFLTVYSDTVPAVQASFIDTLVFIGKKNYLIFDGLKFTGANKTAFHADTSLNIFLKNCDFDNNGTNGISAEKCTNFRIDKNNIFNSLNNGTYLRNCKYDTIVDNYFKNSGAMAGMGESGDGMYNGMYAGGNDTLSYVAYNRLDSSGYNGLMFFSYHGYSYRNLINTYCFVKDDGGGIYTGWDSAVVRGNIILNGPGAVEATQNYNPAIGIYLDAQQGNKSVVDSNSIYYANFSGIYQNQSDNYTITNNTVYNTLGMGLTFGPPTTKMKMTGNVIYTSSDYWSFRKYDPTVGTNIINSNYYLRPQNENDKILNGSIYYNLASWQVSTGFDSQSKETPTGITIDAPLFLYNASKTDSTIALNGSYYDGKSVSFRNQITLKPFTSAILFKAVEDFLKITGQTKNKQFSTLKSL